MMRIYLVGFMGSGKSTAGKRLARYAGLQFVDLDKYIEERYCRSVALIFSLEGEEVFRLKERKALEEVSEFNDVVVATGGGTPCFFDNMDLMNRTGFTLFFDPDARSLTARLSVSKTVRPLIQGKSPQELARYVAETLEKRRPYYVKAQFRIGDPDLNPAEILRMMVPG